MKRLNAQEELPDPFSPDNMETRLFKPVLCSLAESNNQESTLVMYTLSFPQTCCDMSLDS